MSDEFSIPAAKKFLEEAASLIKKGVLEDVLRSRLTSHMPLIFPDQPSWVTHHGLGTERHLKFGTKTQNAGGFVDSLVGLTAIEYEKDLASSRLLTHGLDQVKDYCAGLLNAGHPRDLIVGVLSDTVRWRAYRIADVKAKQTGEQYGREHLSLDELEAFDFSAAGDREARLLVSFLLRHLGREGARPLSAEVLARDLGFDSVFCQRHVTGAQGLVTKAFTSNRKYADLIEKLWRDFVAYLGDTNSSPQFDLDVYTREFYLLTLAKLLCANIIERKALTSNDDELRAILNGDHFRLKGLTNLVEYDYFGWLNYSPYDTQLLPIARGIQDDLRAYDFVTAPVEDLFGDMMAQLAKRSQRLLLGQEWTPSWLAEQLVGKVFDNLPEGEDPRLIDMCCGSGAMIVKAVGLAKARLDHSKAVQNSLYVSRLTHAITGFDIDPLAVMLSKVSWVTAARDRLEPFGTHQIAIPIYHADSLFAATPLSKRIDKETGQKRYELLLDDRAVNLPGFLVSPEYRSLFDGLLSSTHDLAMNSAARPNSIWEDRDIVTIVGEAETNSGVNLGDEDRTVTIAFCKSLVSALEALQRDGRNGIWSFVLSNSYRPGLVTGMFNGLVSNPPWLALSKVGDNPYREALRMRAEIFGIKPAGSSHLHIELATIFLLHSASQYLAEGAAIGCILPESVLSGHHHNPFRMGNFLSAVKPVQLKASELWRVVTGTFKNEAIVFFGTKGKTEKFVDTSIPGLLVGPQKADKISFNVVTQGNRVAWSDRVGRGKKSEGFFEPIELRQGADIMPRTLIFHELAELPEGKWSVKAIDRQRSAFRYLVQDAKKHKDFTLPDCVIPEKFVFDVLMSNHLTPFDLARPAKAILPIQRNSASHWEPVSESAYITNTAVKQIFTRVFAAVGPGTGPADFFEMLDSNRHKLMAQVIPSSGWMLFMGAGGDLPCAAVAEAERFDAARLIVDQTLYWAQVASEDEAFYLCGLLNSEAINLVIKQFQPRGQFGARHVHTLPLDVTPPFDPSAPAHTEVVRTTKELVAAWIKAKESDLLAQGWLDSNRSLAARRRSIRGKLQSLPEYAAYNAACRELYCV